MNDRRYLHSALGTQDGKLGLAGGIEEGFSQEGCFPGDLRKSDYGRRGGREFQADGTVHAKAQRHENAGYIIVGCLGESTGCEVGGCTIKG